MTQQNLFKALAFDWQNLVSLEFSGILAAAELQTCWHNVDDVSGLVCDLVRLDLAWPPGDARSQRRS